MKKAISIILSLAFLFVLVGCNDTDNLSSQNSSIISAGTTSQIESNVESSSQPEETTSEEQSSEQSQVISSETVPEVTNKAITIPITVVFQGDSSEVKNHQTDTYDVVAGDTIVLDFNISTEKDLASIIKTTIDYDSAILSFESCTNTNYAGNVPGTFTVRSFSDGLEAYRPIFKIKLKAVSSGSISINSVIDCFFVHELNDGILKDTQGIS